MTGLGISDGRGYGPYNNGYYRDASGREFPIGPDGRPLPPEYDFQPGPDGSYMPLRRPFRWLPHLGPNPGPELFGVVPPAPAFVGKAPDKVLEGHVRARESMAHPIVGIPDQSSTKAPLEVMARFGEVMQGLIRTHGAMPRSPGFAKVTAAEYGELVSTFVEAVRAGLSGSVARPDGYLLSTQYDMLPLPHVADQHEKLKTVLATEFAKQLGSPDLPDSFKPTELAIYLAIALQQRFAGATDPMHFDPTMGLMALSQLAGQMDRQGVSFSKPDLLSEVEKSIKKLPERAREVWDTAKWPLLGAFVFGGVVLIAMSRSGKGR